MKGGMKSIKNVNNDNHLMKTNFKKKEKSLVSKHPQI